MTLHYIDIIGKNRVGLNFMGTCMDSGLGQTPGVGRGESSLEIF